MRVKKKQKFRSGEGSSQTPLGIFLWELIKMKNLPSGRYGYSLELHILHLPFTAFTLKS